MAPIFREGGRSIDIYTRERKLAREIVPAVERDLPGVEVLALELLSPSRFCVYVDHPNGVDHQLCARVTSLLEPYRSEFTIDVSSPGIERPLTKPAHFRRFLGRRARVRTREQVGGHKNFTGELVGASDEEVTIAASTGVVAIPYADIHRSNLVEE